MPRQRLQVEGSKLSDLAGRALVLLLAAALVYYGAMLILLAFKVDPETVNELSGYRSAFDYLAGLEAGEISSSDRLIGGLIAAGLGLVALWLVWLGLPRPHLARHPVVLSSSPQGETEVKPRAVERAVEVAALEDPRVLGARARFEDEAVVLAIDARDAAQIVETMEAARRRARASVSRHGLTVEQLSVTLASYDSTNRRELA